ncbi:MAG: ABC transporter ATP-binding protein [Coriobacteriia bacterium]
MTNIVEIAGLEKRYDERTYALRGIDLRIAEGEWLTILGPSGSGKSTLLNMLGCLDRPTAGSLQVCGVETSGMKQRELAVFRRENVGLVFQQQHVIPYLTALENVMLAQYYHSVADKDAASAALEHVGLGHRLHHVPGKLSGGEQQRVCIARALINQPKLLLADEPTGNLDRANACNVYDMLSKLHREAGQTIVLVTHDESAAEYGDRTIRIEDGRVVESPHPACSVAS